MVITVIERKSVKGTPVLYLRDGEKYLGSLFCTDESAAAILHLLEAGSAEAGAWHRVEVRQADGRD